MTIFCASITRRLVSARSPQRKGQPPERQQRLGEVAGRESLAFRHLKQHFHASVRPGPPRPPQWQKGRSLPKRLPAEDMFAVWDYYIPLVPSRSLRFRVWVSSMVSLPPPLFIHSFQYTTRFITSMETFVATDLEKKAMRSL